MQVPFAKAFAEDLRNIRGRKLLRRVDALIECVERAKYLSEIPNLKKLRGSGDCFRVRLGEYRAGLILDGDTVTFVRILLRRDIYNYFP
jgi:mRNA interferase RelE/StbE